MSNERVTEHAAILGLRKVQLNMVISTFSRLLYILQLISTNSVVPTI